MIADRPRALPREVAARMSWDELEALGIDDCGLPLDGHPPLPRPAPLGARTAAPSRAFNPRTVLAPPPAPRALTERQARVLAVAWASPTRSEAGRRLGISGQAVSESLQAARRAGHAIPPARR